MAYRLLPEGIKLISITGTNGKTTTTTLTYEIMKEYYKEKVFLAGNLGFPLIDLIGKVKSGDYIVMEVSSQQLVNLKEYKPDVAIFTNLSIAHMEFFKDYDYYKSLKVKLFSNQTKDDVAILKYEDKEVLEQTKDIKSTKKFFSSKNKVDGAYLDGNDIYYNGEYVISRSDIKIAGMHNVENVMGAIAAVKEFNVSNEAIKRVVSTFNGVEHRLEYCCEVNTRKFYNDTEATNIKCTQIALSSFDTDIFVILGGLERNQNFDDLIPYSKNVKGILAIGTCRNRVKEYGDKIGVPVIVSEFLKDGFEALYTISTPNSVILLSPGSASWDQYKECEVRGAEFKQLAKDLEK